MDTRDIALQQSAPVTLVPRYSAFEPMTGNGHRFLVTGDGLWLEARRPWMYLRTPLARQRNVPMPYGVVAREMSLAFGKIPRRLVFEFFRYAAERCPDECVGWIVWNARTGDMRLERLEELSAGCSHVRYTRPTLDEGEHLVVDIHSHGRLSAFFSSEDDRDDRGEFKIAGVVGNCDKAHCSTAFRLCANGLFLPLAFSINSRSETLSPSPSGRGKGRGKRGWQDSSSEATYLPFPLGAEDTKGGDDGYTSTLS